MRKSLLIAAAWIVASAALAQDVHELSPDALRDAAIAAVNDRDEGRLMEIMLEMQKREMVFFRKPKRGPECEREPEKIGVLTAKAGRWGTARQAYFTFLREKAMEAGECGCITARMTFDEFLTEKFGTTTAEMSEEQYMAMQTYHQENSYRIEDEYHAFFKANCRKD